MNKSITGRHFDLTEPIKEYADIALEGLKKYNLDIISANTIISANEKGGKKGFAVEFIINLKDKNTIVVTQVDKDVYAAIDLAIERVKKSLRRFSDKIKNHKIMSFKDLGEGAEAVGELTAEEVEIVPMDLELHKPLEFDEAIDALKAEKKDSSLSLTTKRDKCALCTKERTENSAFISRSADGFAACLPVEDECF